MKKYIAIIFMCFMPSFAFAENSNLATRIIKGHTFNVPKDYLWQGRNVPDGNANKGIYILAEWPNMNPMPAFEDGINIVKVTIKNPDNWTRIKLKNGEELPQYLNGYYTSAGMLRHHKDFKEIVGEPIYIGAYKKINNLSYYKCRIYAL